MSNAFFTERAGHDFSFARCFGVISITHHVAMPGLREAPHAVCGLGPPLGASRSLGSVFSIVLLSLPMKLLATAPYRPSPLHTHTASTST